MKIYSFWSADKTYYTISKSLKKAQEIGKENKKYYMDTCEYLGEKPDPDVINPKNHYFLPESVELIKKEWFQYLMKTDSDTMVLDDELYNLIQ